MPERAPYVAPPWPPLPSGSEGKSMANPTVPVPLATPALLNPDACAWPPPPPLGLVRLAGL